MGKSRRWAALAASAVLAGAVVASGGQPVDAQAPGGSTLNRPADPVVLKGAQLPSLAGTAPGRVVAFAAASGSWAQVPVQVDERKDTTMAAIYNLPTTQTFYNSSINVPVNVYADAGTFTGADTNAALDADDEVAFMARDAGGARGSLAAPAGTSGNGVEVKLDDPAGGTGYVYLFSSNGSLDPAAGKRYVDYQFRLTSGDYKTTYKRTDGPNPETSSITGSSYVVRFSDRWTMDGLNLTRGNRPNADVLDRVKYDIQAFCIRNENTFNDEEGAFVVNRSGPVRALRSYVGSNSGPNTQNTHAFYDTFIDTTVDLRVHAIPNVRAHLDMSREAIGMTLRRPDVPNGVPIDGQPETAGTAAPSWWTITGPQGGLAVAAKYDQNASAAAVPWYEDDTTPADWQCTGDGEAIGDTGAFFNSWIECTDPGTGCNDKHLRSSFRAIAASASTSPAELQRLANHFLQPLRISIDGQGPGPDPDPEECFTALNSAHVTAGRATAFFVWAWAVGSGTFIGATWDTTSLKETSPGRWELVPSC